MNVRSADEVEAMWVFIMVFCLFVSFFVLCVFVTFAVGFDVFFFFVNSMPFSFVVCVFNDLNNYYMCFSSWFNFLKLKNHPRNIKILKLL